MTFGEDKKRIFDFKRELEEVRIGAQISLHGVKIASIDMKTLMSVTSKKYILLYWRQILLYGSQISYL